MTVVKVTIADFIKALRQDGNLQRNTENVNGGRALIYIQNQITQAKSMGQITDTQAEKLYEWSHDYADVVSNKLQRKHRSGT
jgi:hypothetical protein